MVRNSSNKQAFMDPMHKIDNHRGGELFHEDATTQKKPLPVLRKGPYRGDISALCLISTSPYHLLLAGSGPYVLFYDLISGILLCSRYVFDGVRVYGIVSGPAFGTGGKPSTTNVSTRMSSTIVIHGERRAKVFRMLWNFEEKAPELHVLGFLPRFSYWVMDVKLLLGEKATSKPLYAAGPDGGGTWDPQLLAVGLSNNAISIWDIFNSVFISHVDCSEVCLLYSMRLWGDSLQTFRVAAGTVFNEVLVWNLGSYLTAVQEKSKYLTTLGENGESGCPEVFRQQTIIMQNNTRGAGAQSFLQFEAVKASVCPLQRLSGHEGSIYRLMWSSDGLSLMSASDDRSARVWFANRDREAVTDDIDIDIDPWLAGVRNGPVLRGHGSRLWDCFIGEKLLISASEDCTCRVWTAEGEHLATLKGHTGRGIWRCVYDPNFNYLVTGGADSSIRVHSLSNISPRRTFQIGSDLEGQSQNGKRPSHRSNPQIFSVSPPWSKAGAEQSSAFMDSKSEYVRCLLLSDPWSLYVCTNRGVVYHVDLSTSTDAPWTRIVDDLEGPIISMDLLTQKGDGLGFPVLDDVIVVGTGDGKVALMRVTGNAEKEPHCECRCSWVGESERQLLGVHFCRSIGWKYVFTTEPRGRWRLWHVLDERLLPRNSITRTRSSFMPGMDYGDSTKDDAADLIAYGIGSPAHILCIDISSQLQLLVCGDKRGNITAFFVPVHLLQWRPDLKNFTGNNETKGPVQLPVVAFFKGAHGISAVTTVSLLPLKHDQWLEIISTGADSCICTFLLERRLVMKAATTAQGSQHLQCSGIKKVAALSVVEGFPLVYRNNVTMALQKEERKIVAGFSGSDFLLWDVMDHSQVLRVTCGGWRRPHSVIIGDLPELQHCFVYIKDQAIQVQLNWAMSHAGSYDSPLQHEAAPSGSMALTPTRSLRAQFHGKEISSVRLLLSASRLLVHESMIPCDWIATGSEDGTVVISRFTEDPEMGEQLQPMVLLGDHVGGSAIRALAVVTRVHLINDTMGQPRGAGTEADPTDGKEPVQVGNDSQRGGEQELLFSAGAKEVLTCWLLDWLHAKVEIEEASRHLNRDGEPLCPPLQDKKPVSSGTIFSAQWLSTQIPQKGHPSSQAVAHEEKISKLVERMHSQSLPEEQEISNEQSCHQGDSTSTGNVCADDDHRYLGLTAFATRCVKTGALISFVATSSSNAALHIHSFHVTHRFWDELAVLEYPSTLVLTVEHLVAPLPSYCGRSGNSYIILTGAANGNIALWDATNVVSEYVSVALSGENKTRTQVAPLRPLTGRGSQGGRLRKRRGKQRSAPLIGNNENSALQVDVAGILVARELAPSSDQTDISNENVKNPAENSPGVNISEEASQPESPSVLKPLGEFTAAHQSGVNCLSVARVPKSDQTAPDEIEYVMISGGDDQALHVAVFTLKMSNCYDELRNSAENLVVAIAQGNRREGIPPQASLVLRCFTENSVLLAHSSAVKGVWTDGVWAFSTGLDQRLRCWKLYFGDINAPELRDGCTCANDGTKHPKLGSPMREYSTCVIDVPEATSLHVKHCVAERYQIVVVGRGLQVITFDGISLESS